MKRIAFTMLAAAAATTAAPAAAQGACSRELLQGIADSWISALIEGSPFKMNLGEWVDYRQNLEPGFMSEFFTLEPNKVGWNHALLDTTACKVAVESVIVSPKEQVLSTQLSNGFFGVSPIDNLVSSAAAGTLTTQVAQEDWKPLAQPAARAELIAAADAWLADKQAGEAKDRLYVVDEALGAVNVMTKAGADARATSYTLRIEGGQVRHVHTLAK